VAGRSCRPGPRLRLGELSAPFANCTQTARIERRARAQQLPCLCAVWHRHADLCCIMIALELGAPRQASPYRWSLARRPRASPHRWSLRAIGPRPTGGALLLRAVVCSCRPVTKGTPPGGQSSGECRRTGPLRNAGPSSDCLDRIKPPLTLRQSRHPSRLAADLRAGGLAQSLPSVM
jgi:hypothetical protein